MAIRLWADDLLRYLLEGRRGSKKKAVLVSYAAAENRTAARLVGVDANRTVVFDLGIRRRRTASQGWNAFLIALEALTIQ